MAQSVLPSCAGPRENWTNCFGGHTFESGSTYIGEWKDGWQEGQGSFNFNDGGVYIGEFKKGRFSGSGIYKYANGSKYDGEWRNGQHHGKGAYYYANGNRYIGEWEQGQRHGSGTHTYGDRGHFTGEWRSGRPYLKNGSDTHAGESVNTINQLEIPEKDETNARANTRADELARLRKIAGTPSEEPRLVVIDVPRLTNLIRPNIIYPENSPGASAEVLITVWEDGTLKNYRLVRSTGHDGWNKAVLRAISRVDKKTFASVYVGEGLRREIIITFKP